MSFDLETVIHPRIIVYPGGNSGMHITGMLGTISEDHRYLARITGGCAKMTAESAAEVEGVLPQAFHGYKGAVLIGGTRMIQNDDPDDVLFGITESAHQIRAENPDAFVLGIIPGWDEITFNTDKTMLVVEECKGKPDRPDHLTIIHPKMDLVVGINERLTKKEIWFDEAMFAAQMSDTLVRADNRWQPFLVSIDGGDVTEHEILDWAERGWPVILAAGTGRATDHYATSSKTRGFRESHPNVIVCNLSVASIRHELAAMGAVETTHAGRALYAV